MRITSFTKSRLRGVALVIVLSVLVLMSALVVGFMTSVATERSSTRANAGIIGARHLSDTALNLVIAQIREATGGYRPGTRIADETLTWATQPGVIRTFNGKSGSRKSLGAGAYDLTYNPGNGDFVFKLYSAEKMTVKASDYAKPAAGDLGAEVSFIENYNPSQTDVTTNPALADWVDLNEPFFVPALSAGTDTTIVEPRYPIVDPRAKADFSGTFVTAGTYGSVEGFDCKGFEHPTLNYMARTSTGSYARKKVPLLPMPVRWLYQLKDGTLVPSVNGRIAGATKENPIVGRIAFWTDDESCKLNINTACEGTFWGTPTASSIEESGKVDRSGNLITIGSQYANLSASQPVRGEYQRYPGHPATTSLSPALGWLWGLNPNQSTSQTPIPQEFKEAMAALTPFMAIGRPSDRLSHRLASGTTAGGFQNADTIAPDYNTLRAGEVPILNIPTRYLRATVDELLFDAERFPRGAKLEEGKANPTATIGGNGKINADSLERLRAFLTTVSRAPDLTGFGRPRVNIWPVSSERTFRTSYDELFAYTSTINANGTGANGPKPFYFTRWDARCNENDLWVDVVNPSGRNPDLMPVLRGRQNRDMLRYLAFLTGNGDYGAPVLSQIPGFGGSLGAKYSNTNRDPRVAGNAPTEMSQILTEILDYMRTVNISDTGEGKQAGNFRPYTPRFYKSINTDGYDRLERSSDGSGQVTPLITRGKDAARGGAIGTQGMGRFLTVSDASIMFYKTRTRTAPVEDAIQAVLILQMTTTMPNYPGIRDTFFTKIRELAGARNKIKIAPNQPASDLNFSTDFLINVNNVSAHEIDNGRGFMPTLGWVSHMHWFPTHPAPTSTGAPPNPAFMPVAKTFSNDATTYPEIKAYARGRTEKIYPYVSDPISIMIPDPADPSKKKNAPDFEWTGGSFEVEIYAGEAPDDPAARLVQTIQFAFPNRSIKFGMVTESELQSRFNGALTEDTRGPNTPFLRSNDVIRAVEYVGTDAAGARLPLAMQGDFRIAACQPFLDEANYAPREAGMPNNGQYFDGSRRSLHVLRSSWGRPKEGYSSTARGFLTPGGGHRVAKPAILPAGINGVQMTNGNPGDFDRGLSKHMSGSFGNKVDEGNIQFGYNDPTESGILPYFRGRNIEETGQSFFSPNRQIPSPITFGSLPTGVFARKPWQTLLFRPNRSQADHPGADVQGQPPDYHLLDLFHLPIIEPYAISEPFSTAGKVNLNYVMAPFGYAKGGTGANPDGNARSYIRRDTALRGVMKSVKMMMVPTNMHEGGYHNEPVTVNQQYRYDIDLNATIGTIETRLKDSDRGLFRSSAEICNVDLVPQQISRPSDWKTFWETTYACTGDNMRELPYSHIYPRITTKSNVFTVHMRCQTIRKAPSSSPDRFEEGKDVIVGEYRGSSVIERFIDPNDPKLADYDYTKRDATGRLDPYYRFRILSSKQFTAH